MAVPKLKDIDWELDSLPINEVIYDMSLAALKAKIRACSSSELMKFDNVHIENPIILELIPSDTEGVPIFESTKQINIPCQT